jgi:predicted DCC family thiol-disulfide oxidoreductase YuxK
LQENENDGTREPSTATHPVILYDGVCGLCNRLNQFVLKRDKQGRFRFATLQSDYAREILLRHSADPADLDTLYVVTDLGGPNERARKMARAALFVLWTIGGAWRLFVIFGILPTFLLNLGYRLVAANRYRFFGKSEQCMIPDPKWRDRFIESE